MKAIWNFFGKLENHNAAVVFLMVIVPILVTAIGLYVEFRLTRVETRIDELFDRQVTEISTLEDLRAWNPELLDLGEEDTLSQVSLKLRNRAVANSVSLWIGGFFQNPTEYTVADETLVLDLRPPVSLNYFVYLQNDFGKIAVVVYTKE